MIKFFVLYRFIVLVGILISKRKSLTRTELYRKCLLTILVCDVSMISFILEKLWYIVDYLVDKIDYVEFRFIKILVKILNIKSMNGEYYDK